MVSLFDELQLTKDKVSPIPLDSTSNSVDVSQEDIFQGKAPIRTLSRKTNYKTIDSKEYKLNKSERQNTKYINSDSNIPSSNPSTPTQDKYIPRIEISCQAHVYTNSFDQGSFLLNEPVKLSLGQSQFQWNESILSQCHFHVCLDSKEKHVLYSVPNFENVFLDYIFPESSSTLSQAPQSQLGYFNISFPSNGLIDTQMSVTKLDCNVSPIVKTKGIINLHDQLVSKTADLNFYDTYSIRHIRSLHAFRNQHTETLSVFCITTTGNVIRLSGFPIMPPLMTTLSWNITPPLYVVQVCQTLYIRHCSNISCGQNHFGMITKSGDVWSVGSNSENQLGVPNTELSESQLPIYLKLGEDNGIAKLIACGVSHTVIATTTEYILQVGYCEMSFNKISVCPLTTDGTNNWEIYDLGAGNYFSVVIIRKQLRINHIQASDFKIFSWGKDNSNGQLGRNISSNDLDGLTVGEIDISTCVSPHSIIKMMELNTGTHGVAMRVIISNYKDKLFSVILEPLTSVIIWGLIPGVDTKELPWVWPKLNSLTNLITPDKEVTKSTHHSITEILALALVENVFIVISLVLLIPNIYINPPQIDSPISTNTSNKLPNSIKRHNSSFTQPPNIHSSDTSFHIIQTPTQNKDASAVSLFWNRWGDMTEKVQVPEQVLESIQQLESLQKKDATETIQKREFDHSSISSSRCSESSLSRYKGMNLRDKSGSTIVSTVFPTSQHTNFKWKSATGGNGVSQGLNDQDHRVGRPALRHAFLKPMPLPQPQRKSTAATIWKNLTNLGSSSTPPIVNLLSNRSISNLSTLSSVLEDGNDLLPRLTGEEWDIEIINSWKKIVVRFDQLQKKIKMFWQSHLLQAEFGVAPRDYKDGNNIKSVSELHSRFTAFREYFLYRLGTSPNDPNSFLITFDESLLLPILSPPFSRPRNIQRKLVAMQQSLIKRWVQSPCEFEGVIKSRTFQQFDKGSGYIDANYTVTIARLRRERIAVYKDICFIDEDNMDDVPFQEWEVDKKELKYLKNVANSSLLPPTGAEHHLYSAMFRGVRVGVKITRVSTSSDLVLRRRLREVFIHSKLRHPHILTFMGGVIRGPEIVLIAEWGIRGNLFELLHESSFKLNAQDQIRIAAGIASGLNYLHRSGPIVHRDIKSANIILTGGDNNGRGFIPKICDFEIAICLPKQIGLNYQHTLIGEKYLFHSLGITQEQRYNYSMTSQKEASFMTMGSPSNQTNGFSSCDLLKSGTTDFNNYFADPINSNRDNNKQLSHTDPSTKINIGYKIEGFATGTIGTYQWMAPEVFSLEECAGLPVIHKLEDVVQRTISESQQADSSTEDIIQTYGTTSSSLLIDSLSFNTQETIHHREKRIDDSGDITYNFMPRIIYTEKVDVFSFGVLLWELCVRTPPFLGMDGQMIARLVSTRELRLPLPSSISSCSKAIIAACTHSNPARRPDMATVIDALSIWETTLHLDSMGSTGEVVETAREMVFDVFKTIGQDAKEFLEKNNAWVDLQSNSKDILTEQPAYEEYTVTVPDPCGSSSKRLVTPALAKTLTKAGYSIVGSHSAVKICRWTKNQLQGRGGCYKHTFYGIESHRCIEATTFLACANRCVFCWRHHTHPVSRDFSRWTPDLPETILESALTQFHAMIKPLKGLQGVTTKRYQEALTPQHCALSLVGEPIVYPYITEFINLLNEKKISSFLVTNGQHPEAINNLKTVVTQLYISVDAPDPDTLKKIGRPLFKDYWERLLESLYLLSQRTERTVVRLTLVNQWNDSYVEGYAKLIYLAQPDFIEIKAFTYPGPSASIMEAGLTIKHCPTERQIISFSKRLVTALHQSSTPEQKCWDIASEHIHSNSILLASLDFYAPFRTSAMSPLMFINQQNIEQTKKDGIGENSSMESVECTENHWKCWIDFDKFHTLKKPFNNTCSTYNPSGNIDGTLNNKFAIQQKKPFASRFASLYSLTSPIWTAPDSLLGGFDPEFDVNRWIQQRKIRKQHEIRQDE